VRVDGATTLGPFALNEAGNVFVWLDHVGPHGLQAGNHHFVVTYNGDASFNPNTGRLVLIETIAELGTIYGGNDTIQVGDGNIQVNKF